MSKLSVCVAALLVINCTGCVPPDGESSKSDSGPSGPEKLLGGSPYARTGASDPFNRALGRGQQTAAMSDLKQIGMALLFYESDHRRFPPPRGSQLSWRVHLLPYLEQRALYRQFNMREPWDSPHNKKLLASMPKIYAVGGDRSTGKTVIVAPAGRGTVLGDANPVSSAAVPDGASATVAVILAGPEKGIPWTRPDDAYDPRDPAKAIGKVGPKFLALMVDGSVQQIDVGSAQTLHSLFQRADGR